MPDPTVSIIVPTCGSGCSYLKDLVPVLLEEPETETIIVDNRSEDQTLSYLERYKLHLKVIANKANFGYGIANNQAAEIAKGEFLLLLNNDTLPDKGFVAKMLLNFNNPKVGMLGVKMIDLRPPFGCQGAGVLMRQDGWPIVVGHPDRTHPSVNIKKYYPYVTAACCMIRKTLFDSIGGFYPGYRTSFEDNELCLRVYEKGYKILCDPTIEVRHQLHGSKGRMDNEEHNIALFDKRCIETGLYKIAQEASQEPY